MLCEVVLLAWNWFFGFSINDSNFLFKQNSFSIINVGILYPCFAQFSHFCVIAKIAKHILYNFVCLRYVSEKYEIELKKFGRYDLQDFPAHTHAVCDVSFYDYNDTWWLLKTVRMFSMYYAASIISQAIYAIFNLFK